MAKSDFCDFSDKQTRRNSVASISHHYLYHTIIADLFQLVYLLSLMRSVLMFWTLAVATLTFRYGVRYTAQVT